MKNKHGLPLFRIFKYGFSFNEGGKFNFKLSTKENYFFLILSINKKYSYLIKFASGWRPRFVFTTIQKANA